MEATLTLSVRSDLSYFTARRETRLAIILQHTGAINWLATCNNSDLIAQTVLEKMGFEWRHFPTADIRIFYFSCATPSL